MRRHIGILLFVSIPCFVALAQTENTHRVGYVYCASDRPEHSVTAFFTACMKTPVGNFPCGQKVEVVGRSGSALEIARPSGPTVFLGIDVVSQKAEELVPIEIEAGPPPDCKVAVPDLTKNRPPRVTFRRDPDYPDDVPRTRDPKTVTFGLVVGKDGHPYDIKVESSPNKRFTEQAMQALKEWRFEPGRKDGQPADMPIKVEMIFRLFY